MNFMVAAAKELTLFLLTAIIVVSSDTVLIRLLVYRLKGSIKEMSKTALELTPTEWQAYHPGTRSEGDPEESTAPARQEQARQLARQAAELLREKFQAQRVVLFGSLAAPSGFNRWSDIDLAAWGIPADRFYAAVAAVTGLSPDFKVDLVDPETCRPGLKSAIEREGLDL
jgi:predicted nucleotidyltransferase